MIFTPQSPWLNPPGKTAVFLIDSSSGLEKEIIQQWISSTHPTPDDGGDHFELVFLEDWAKKKNPQPAQELAKLLDNSGENYYFIPVRVLWFPRKIKGERRARLSDLIFGDPRNPREFRQRWIHKREPERCHLVAAEGSNTRDLVDRYDQSSTTELQSNTLKQSEFILRQAVLALERAERRQRGARYKVPRLVADAVLNEPKFLAQLQEIALEENLDLDDASKEAAACLKEMAADHRTFVLDLMVSLSRFLYRKGFDPQIQYLDTDVKRVRELSQQFPVCFLMTHKSYLDGCVMASLVYELDLPPLHLFGGINLDFFAAGTFARRSGTIFIRRSFQDDKIYKLVIRNYIKYLVEKRFPLNWAFEGTRSRTGKLMPPKYGLLRYVMDGARGVKDSNLLLIPVSIAYDQLPDVSDYIKEQKGAAKKNESFGWLKKYINALSKPYGKIHVRFGQELDAFEHLRSTEEPRSDQNDIDQLEIQKLAFQVAVEANRVTPITATSLIIFVLLAEGYKALTLNELLDKLGHLAEVIARKKLPKTSDFNISDEQIVVKNLHALSENDILICHEEGSEPVYAVAHGSKVAAAYYRNSMVHFFVNSAIAELSLIAVADSTGEAALHTLHTEALHLRDLLKFEFFFSDKTTFINEIESELTERLENWQDILISGEDTQGSLTPLYPLITHGTLRPFIEAYRVAADALVVIDPAELQDKKALVKKCMSLGQQLVLQQRVASDDSINKAYFDNAIKLAESRGLLQVDATQERLAFVTEIEEHCRRLDLIASRVTSRHSGNPLSTDQQATGENKA